MRKHLALLCAVAVIGGLFSFVGCENGTGSGTLRILVTDKPFPIELIESARITITRVEVRGGSGNQNENGADDEDNKNENDNGGDAGNANDNSNDSDNENDNTGDSGNTNDNGDANDNGNGDDDEHGGIDDNDGSGEDTNSGFVTIFEGAREFELLDLQNGRTAVLADTELAEGTYTQVRLIVTTGTVVSTNGDEYVLNVPSGARTGIKLNFDFDIAPDEQTQLLLDVDLSRAFKVIPGGRLDDPSQITEIKFQPSLALRLINLVDAGSLVGVISDGQGLPIAGALVTAYREGGEEVTSTASEADGSYALSGLPPGMYRLEVSATGFEDGGATAIEVSAGQEPSGVDFVLTADAE